MKKRSYRFKLGNFECLLVLDGTFAYPHPAQALFTNASEERLKQVLREHKLDQETWEQYISPYPSLVIYSADHVVLVDTGGGSFAPTTGKLIENLKTEGISPEDIDTVILTHSHPDHIGGNLDGKGKPAFPNARYVMRKEEWKFWTGDPDLSALKMPDHFKETLLEFAAKNLPPIQDQLNLIDGESEIVPGIQAIPASGHTPGHIALAISSDGKKLLSLVDTVLHPIHLEQPDWYAAVDLLPEETGTTRHRLLGRAAAEKTLAFTFHFPFPCLGHVVQKGDAWRWQPIEIED